MKTNLNRLLLFALFVGCVFVSESLTKEKEEKLLLKASFYENASWSKIWRLEISDTYTAKLYYTPGVLGSPQRKIEKKRKLGEEEIKDVVRISELIKLSKLKDIDNGSFTDGPEFFIASYEGDMNVGSVSVSMGASGRDSNEKLFLEAWEQLSDIFPKCKVNPRDYVSKESDQNQSSHTTPAIASR